MERTRLELNRARRAKIKAVAERVVQQLTSTANAWHNSATIPAEDKTEDAKTVALRYFALAYPDDWVLAEGHADKHLDGDEPAELEIQELLAVMVPGTEPLQAAMELVRTAGPQDVTAERESTNPLRITFTVQLGRVARAFERTDGGRDLNPKAHHSIAGVIERSDYIRITIFHIGPGYGVN